MSGETSKVCKEVSPDIICECHTGGSICSFVLTQNLRCNLTIVQQNQWCNPTLVQQNPWYNPTLVPQNQSMV